MIDVETRLEKDLAEVTKAVRVNSALLLGEQLGLDMRDLSQVQKAYRYLSIIERVEGEDGE